MEGNRITLYRSGVGAYNGVVTTDGRSLNGTCDFIGGGWSATFTSPILGANAVSEKAKSLLPASFTMKQWSGAESWTWTMTQRTADNWGATVRQDQSGQQGSGSFTVTKVEGNRITINRDGAGNYVGVVSADGRAITGTCDFIGGGWSIALAGAGPTPPTPPPGPGGTVLDFSGTWSYYGNGYKGELYLKQDGTQIRGWIGVNKVNLDGDTITGTVNGNQILFTRNNRFLARPQEFRGYIMLHDNPQIEARRRMTGADALAGIGSHLGEWNFSWYATRLGPYREEPPR